MGWGTSDESARKRSTGGFQSPPANDTPSPPKTETPLSARYSFKKESPGYFDHVVNQAMNHCHSIGADFTDLFTKVGATEAQRRAIEFFSKLDHNERAALEEFRDQMTENGY